MRFVLAKRFRTRPQNICDAASSSSEVPSINKTLSETSGRAAATLHPYYTRGE